MTNTSARAAAVARCQPLQYVPRDADVDALIDRAVRHPLGLEFLRRGHLGTVAVMFRTHAFTVVAARERLDRAG